MNYDARLRWMKEHNHVGYEPRGRYEPQIREIARIFKVPTSMIWPSMRAQRAWKIAARRRR